MQMINTFPSRVPTNQVSDKVSNGTKMVAAADNKPLQKASMWVREADVKE